MCCAKGSASATTFYLGSGSTPSPLPAQGRILPTRFWSEPVQPLVPGRLGDLPVFGADGHSYKARGSTWHMARRPTAHQRSGDRQKGEPGPPGCARPSVTPGIPAYLGFLARRRIRLGQGGVIDDTDRRP